MLRHVSTHWLSLGSAIGRLLQSWPVLISYFKSLGADCPKRLSKAMGLHSDDEEDGDVKLDVTKAGLHFARSLCNVILQTVLALEGDDVTFCELFPIMSGLRAKLTDRPTDKYFGEDISTILENEDMPPAAKRKIENNFCADLQRASERYRFSGESPPTRGDSLLNVIGSCDSILMFCRLLKTFYFRNALD